MHRRTSSDAVLEDDDEAVDKLLALVKKEVKQVMEEAVTRKFVHEDSGSVTSLCGAVESCLRFRLRRQTISIFSNTKPTEALLRKLAKDLPVAERVVQLLSEMEGDSERPSRLSFKNRTHDKKSENSSSKGSGQQRYTWIRIALFNRTLAKIVTYLVEHSSKYYESDALVYDPSRGSLFAQLLEGPCALEYSKMRTCDHLFTDPHADELVLRQRLHSATGGVGKVSNASPNKRPALNASMGPRNTSSSSEENSRAGPVHAREYVRSLHQNSQTLLLYGKNNVKVQPKGGSDVLPGYLSLHQSDDGLCLKWTPNKLMSSGSEESLTDTFSKSADSSNGSSGSPRFDPKLVSLSSNPSHTKSFLDKSKTPLYWDCAISMEIDEVVYLHCHHQGTFGGTLILVGIDGVQSPPFYFPFGGHLLAFLTCLETGLQPNARIDPPLWIHKDTGKIFPSVRRRLSSLNNNIYSSCPTISNKPVQSLRDDNDVDYVFRILRTRRIAESVHQLIDPSTFSFRNLDLFKNFKLPKFSSSKNTSLEKTASLDKNASLEKTASIESQDSAVATTTVALDKPPLETRRSLQRLCETMRQTLLSRAFYGWLTHCRHIRTVHEHLAGLVYSGEVVLPVPEGNKRTLTTQFWHSLSDKQRIAQSVEIYRRIYYGGVSPELRKEVWPYLLGHYSFGQTEVERKSRDKLATSIYETTLAHWKSLEDIISQQRDHKNQRCNGTSTNSDSHDSHPIIYSRRESNLSNDVFIESTSVDETKTPDNKSSSKTRKSLTKWKTIDSSYREDYCAVTISDNTPLSKSIGSGLEDQHPGDPEITEAFLDELDLNLHRIDKDVHRCDRSYWYFTEHNLKKLRNIMGTYVFKHLNVGYIQGMCDLAAPLLVIFDDEVMTYSCFTELMKRMVDNFPSGAAMDCHLANMRSLIRVLDPELFELMQHNGDYTHLFFCYRWLLLDFKREMCYDDIFLIWESIWSAKHVCSDNYVVFIALAMLEIYRDILLDNKMDFIDVMKFFNEMAEKHDAEEILGIARQLVHRLQSLIDNK